MGHRYLNVKPVGQMLGQMLGAVNRAVLSASASETNLQMGELPLNEALGNEYHYVYDRSTVRQKRDAKEIGISALRGGTIVGEHEVIFAGTDEVIEFKHTAYSRSVFGKGAVEAAKFLAGKESGMYDMSDVVGL